MRTFISAGLLASQVNCICRRSSDTVFFEKYNGNVFENDKAQEDTDAVFFDADQDGDEDLYVVSGGCQEQYGVTIEDRLYLNDGKGDFVRTVGCAAEMGRQWFLCRCCRFQFRWLHRSFHWNKICRRQVWNVSG